MLLAALGISGSWDDIFFRWLTPVTISIAALGAVLPVKGGPARLLCRTLITSFSACFAIPTIVWALLAWREGLEILYVVVTGSCHDELDDRDGLHILEEKVFACGTLSCHEMMWLSLVFESAYQSTRSIASKCAFASSENSGLLARHFLATSPRTR
jgi:hypothetical protein